MDLVDPVIQEYAWGSRTLIAQLVGEEGPTDRPQAELWFGAHPVAPSTVGGVPLDRIIAADPSGQVGDVDKLPFLLKVLAAGGPLSLQAHPSKALAEEGFAAENAAGVPLDSPVRNYRDANHKPELLVALTEFHALAGFRPVARTRELFEALGVRVLLDAAESLEHDSDLHDLLTSWLTLREDQVDACVRQVTSACRRGLPGWMAPVAETTVDLAERYPGDPGVLASLLLNRVTLKPGEAVFLGAGILHAYLSGLGVEIMANSDNVLRGGLTAKHVDVPDLLKVLRFEATPDPVLAPTAVNGVTVYDVPVEEFSLRSVRPDGAGHRVDGPAMVLVTEGHVLVDGEELPRGRTAWIPASRSVEVTRATPSDPATAFVATVPGR